MKKQLVMVMLVLLVFCWYVAVEDFFGAKGKYQDAMNTAYALEQKEIYIRAIDSYNEALTYKPKDLDAMYGIATDYKQLEESDEYESQMHAILQTFGPNEKILKELYQYYMDLEEISEAAELVYDLKKKFPEDELVNTLYEERKGDYTDIFRTYEGISNYILGKYAIYQFGEKKGLIDEEGEVLIDAKYDEIGYPSGDSDYIPVIDGGKAYWINDDGYKVYETDEKYEYLASTASECTLAKKNGLYGYLDESYVEKTAFEWEDATMIYEKIGAVKKNGKWALINNEFSLVTDYIYDDVIYNEWHVCSKNAVVWVGKNGKYQLVDSNGETLTENTYDEAKCFVGTQACAVRKGDKWGFVSGTGEEIIAPQYEEAQPFHLGFAPVKLQSQWGLIDENNKLVIDYSFDEMKSLNDAGVLPVKQGDVWSLIQLKIYK